MLCNGSVARWFSRVGPIHGLRDSNLLASFASSRNRVIGFIGALRTLLAMAVFQQGLNEAYSESTDFGKTPNVPELS